MIEFNDSDFREHMKKRLIVSMNNWRKKFYLQ